MGCKFCGRNITRQHYCGSICRIMRMSEVVGGCWEWKSNRNKKGYGRVRISRRLFFAHRVSYTAFIGPIPEGMCIDHLCRNPSCVCPFHLEVVTPQENTRRTPVFWNSTKTHCPFGHPYEAGNLILRKDGKRRCRTCRSEIDRRHRSKLKSHLS